MAEIHSKRCPEIEGNEDMLTSAVFGHLRLVPPQHFWQELFEQARTAGVPATTLTATLASHSIRLCEYTKLEVDFWRNCGDFGEPDLLLKFRADGLAPIVFVIEVKLDSGKSSTGRDDQLMKYLRFLDSAAAAAWCAGAKQKCVIFLTRTFIEHEIEDSIAQCHWTSSARSRIFGLEWSQVLEAVRRGSHEANAAGDCISALLLDETKMFLSKRGFESFKGFATRMAFTSSVSGRFYAFSYFSPPTRQMHSCWPEGGFYGK